MDKLEPLQELLRLDYPGNSAFDSPKAVGRVGVGGVVLGAALGAHAVLLVLAAWRRDLALFQWCLYAVALSGFHVSEFAVTAVCQPARASYDSMLINHSPAYTAAALASWLEFWLEYLLCPSLKGRPAAMAAGVALVAAGQFLRGAAMWTAGANFAHVIMRTKDPSHRLVTHGVYSRLRHPSYCGWFWWSVGTQVLLGNPVCVLAYAAAAYAFFSTRVPFEEATLLHFYGDEYRAYLGRTWIGIPGVVGCPAGTGTAAAAAEASGKEHGH